MIDLADTITINQNKVTSSIYQQSFYNTDQFDIDINFNCCDSLYTTFTYKPVYDTLITTIQVYILSDSNFIVLTPMDSIQGYWRHTDTTGIRTGRRWQFGDTIKYRNTFAHIGDTLNVYQTSYNFLYNDTTFTHQANKIHYGIAYTVFYKNQVLPVELTAFTATKTDNQDILLNWTTASETQNKLFEIERSQNGENWQKIGKVPGNNNTIKPTHYQFLDKIPFLSDNYYRLKQIDFDGNYEYSEVKYIRFGNTRTVYSREPYPNPTHDLRETFTGYEVARITNLYGQIQDQDSTGLLFVTARRKGTKFYRTYKVVVIK